MEQEHPGKTKLSLCLSNVAMQANMQSGKSTVGSKPKKMYLKN